MSRIDCPQPEVLTQCSKALESLGMLAGIAVEQSGIDLVIIGAAVSDIRSVILLQMGVVGA
jgi:hypothetical protein